MIAPFLNEHHPSWEGLKQIDDLRLVGRPEAQKNMGSQLELKSEFPNHGSKEVGEVATSIAPSHGCCRNMSKSLALTRFAWWPSTLKRLQAGSHLSRIRGSSWSSCDPVVTRLGGWVTTQKKFHILGDEHPCTLW